MSDTIDIDTLKTHLATISNARRDIILSADTVEDKQTKLTLLDKENDELNQSIDIFFRLMEYTATTDIEKINELLLSLENGTVDIISKFAPALYQDMAQHFSSNTGLSVTQLCFKTSVQASSYQDFLSHYSITPYGSLLNVLFLNDITFSGLLTKSVTLDLNLQGNKLYFDGSCFNSSYEGLMTLFFSNCEITKSSSHSPFDSPILCSRSPLFLRFLSVSFKLGDGSYIFSDNLSNLYLTLYDVRISKALDYDGGLLINTGGRKVDVILYSVILEDDLQWSDIVDNINNINFI